MSLLKNENADRELNAELRFHLEQQTASYIDSGIPPEEARRRAMLDFGGFQQTKEIVRDVKWRTHLENFLRDIRYAFRQLRKKPAFVLAVILSFGLGIGANATIFSMVSTFVLRPAPVTAPNQLLSLNILEKGSCCNHFSGLLYEDVSNSIQSFSGVAAYYELVPASIGGQGEPERVWGQITTANYFDVAQVGMALGRGFHRDEEHQPVVVIGNRIWKHRFNSDPNLIGKTLLLSGHPYTIVGVTTPGFHGLDLILDSQFWVPMGNIDELAAGIAPKPADRIAREYHWLAVIARLKPGATREQAAAELDTFAQNSAAAHPQFEKDLGIAFVTANSLPARDRQSILLFLTALSVVAFLVLCIACANVTNLFLAHAASRQREMAVRISLGASKLRLLRQVLTESLMLSIFGGVLGVLIALWATKALSSFRMPVPIPLDLSVTLDWRVLIFAFALSIFAGFLFGFAPAWTASHPKISRALKGEELFARAGRIFTLRNSLIVVQVAMSVVLLSATGLFLRSLKNASTMNIGFKSSGTLIMSVDPRVHGYSPEKISQFLEQLRERCAAIPGATGAAYTDITPLSMGGRSDGFTVVGRRTQEPVSIVDLYMVSPGYFDLLGIPRIAGRDFSSESATSPRVAIVNQRFAEALFGRENPIGQQVNGAGVVYEIIGVVGNTKSRTLGEETRPLLFRSLAQTVANDPSGMGYSILVGYSGSPSSLALAVRNEIHTLDPSLAIYNVKTMSDQLRDALFLPRLAGVLFGLFGFLGLTLAAIGLYGVMSYSVSRRTREIGIRLALGAPAGGVLKLVVRQGMTLVLIALLIGVPAALAAAKVATAFLYGVKPHDLGTFLLVPLFLALVALVACYFPARRASRVDPLTSLRYE